MDVAQLSSVIFYCHTNTSNENPVSKNSKEDITFRLQGTYFRVRLHGNVLNLGCSCNCNYNPNILQKSAVVLQLSHQAFADLRWNFLPVLSLYPFFLITSFMSKHQLLSQLLQTSSEFLLSPGFDPLSEILSLIQWFLLCVHIKIPPTIPNHFIFQLFLRLQSISFFDPAALIAPLSPTSFYSSADWVVTTFSSLARSVFSNLLH